MEWCRTRKYGVAEKCIRLVEDMTAGHEIWFEIQAELQGPFLIAPICPILNHTEKE